MGAFRFVIAIRPVTFKGNVAKTSVISTFDFRKLYLTGTELYYPTDGCEGVNITLFSLSFIIKI